LPHRPSPGVVGRQSHRRVRFRPGGEKEEKKEKKKTRKKKKKEKTKSGRAHDRWPLRRKREGGKKKKKKGRQRTPIHVKILILSPARRGEGEKGSPERENLSGKLSTRRKQKDQGFERCRPPEERKAKKKKKDIADLIFIYLHPKKSYRRKGGKGTFPAMVPLEIEDT